MGRHDFNRLVRFRNDPKKTQWIVLKQEKDWNYELQKKRGAKDTKIAHHSELIRIEMPSFDDFFDADIFWNKFPKAKFKIL